MKKRLKRITAKKLQLDQLRPLPKKVEQGLEEWLKVELTYASNAIEGNTLTRVETAEVIERGIDAALRGKPLKDQLEAISHAKAVELIKTLAKEKESHHQITESDILAIHRIILAGIDEEWAGRYRQSEVIVKGTEFQFPLPHQVPYHMAEFIQWLGQQQAKHPVQVAADAHYRLVSIHPFVDGNGRTARLLMNLILLINAFPLAIIRNEDRTEYLESFRYAQAAGGSLAQFYAVIEKAVERSLDAHLAAAKGRPSLPYLTRPAEKPKTVKLLKTGELARQTDESIYTLRYWTNLGLLTVAGQTPGGRHLFHPAMIDRVRQIRSLQRDERLTLTEIRDRLSKKLVA